MTLLPVVVEAEEEGAVAFPVVEAADFHVVALPQAAVFRPVRDEPAH